MDRVIHDSSSDNIIVLEEENRIVNIEDVTVITELNSDTITINEQTPNIILALEQGPPGPPGPTGDEELKYDLILEELNAEGDLYVGEAIPGASTASAVWRIYFYDVTNNFGEKRYADGTADFSKVWDDRASYSY